MSGENKAAVSVAQVGAMAASWRGKMEKNRKFGEDISGKSDDLASAANGNMAKARRQTSSDACAARTKGVAGGNR